MSRTPILDRTEGELFFRTAPFVLKDGGQWRMWYIGGSGWRNIGGRLQPLYSLRHTRSEDGILWDRPSIECLTPNAASGEIVFGRPFIVESSGIYHMWYSIRREAGYVLGYATSSDGLAWERLDADVGIDRSDCGWDSEMICYAAVVPGEKRWLMFYNGNGYGRTGVGAAELTSM